MTRADRWAGVVLAAAALGCTDPLLDADFDGGTYLVLSGPVASGIAIEGSTTRAAIAWAWVYDGILRGRVEEVDFEPRVFSYAITVDHMPYPTAAALGQAPTALVALEGIDLIWGVPFLFEPSTSADQLALEVDPDELLAWARGEQLDARDAIWPVTASEGVVAAVARDHLLVSMRSDGPLARLADHPDWSADAPCALAEVIGGLTLYRRGSGQDPSFCTAWNALAAPGERTEFQGVEMGPVAPQR